ARQFQPQPDADIRVWMQRKHVTIERLGVLPLMERVDAGCRISGRECSSTAHDSHPNRLRLAQQSSCEGCDRHKKSQQWQRHTFMRHQSTHENQKPPSVEKTTTKKNSKPTTHAADLRSERKSAAMSRGVPMSPASTLPFSQLKGTGNP